MNNPHKNQPGIGHVWRAMAIARQGFVAAWRCEDAFRQEVLIALVAMPVALWFGGSALAKALLVGSIFAVLIVELLNSALEAAVDHTSLADHPLAKRAKDIASAAVLLSIINAAAIWSLIFLF